MQFSTELAWFRFCFGLLVGFSSWFFFFFFPYEVCLLQLRADSRDSAGDLRPQSQASRRWLAQHRTTK